MNIKDFLIDNYIWILVIILITIITIIGFLADKKKGEKKGQNISQANPNVNNQPVNSGMPLQYQQQNQINNNQMNNMGMNSNNMNIQAPLNQTPNQNVQMPNNQNVGNNMNTINPMITEPQPVQMGPTNMAMMNNPQPVENVAPNVEQESMYQPLSEQKPIIPPQPIPNFSNVQNFNNQDMSTPMMEQSMPQVAANFVTTPQMNQAMNSVAPVMQEPIMNQSQTYNVMPQMTLDNNTQGMVPNVIQNNTTIPQPVNPTPIPVPQPVSPQPIMQNQYNSQTMVQPNYSQPMQAMPQPVQEQPVVTSPQPINFVYGPQNNNQNM